ncbi:hypothetical protein M5X11_27995 [Paenibacillus alginolyticus]|uniref:hypothetical protein n=1 Tax=Paenibacillus alginolyticus TaxID=59839 RepID=UPI000492E2EF|nr:hypothetical protein [Paenibacillus alginolyticus]MCY9668720.1 hypothetical protein [Paenibacillus alginolyticus]
MSKFRETRKRLLQQRFLSEVVVHDLITRSPPREKALELVFNGYMLEDSVMESKYEQEGMTMNVVKDWEALVANLSRRVQNGDASCRPLLEKAERELLQAREKDTGQSGNGR